MKIIEAINVDGASGQRIESSSFDPSSDKKGKKFIVKSILEFSINHFFIAL